MKKFFCIISGELRKFENLKMSYIFEKILVISIFCSKCEKKM